MIRLEKGQRINLEKEGGSNPPSSRKDAADALLMAEVRLDTA